MKRIGGAYYWNLIKKLLILAPAILLLSCIQDNDYPGQRQNQEKEDSTFTYQIAGQETGCCINDIQSELSYYLESIIGMDIPAVLNLCETLGFDGISEISQVLCDTTTYYCTVLNYKSKVHDKELLLSGKILYKKTADGKIETPDHILLYNRHTHASESLLDGVGLEYLFARYGELVIVPDMIGHGTTANLTEPFCIPSLTSSSVLDMYRAAMDFLSDQNIENVKDIPLYIIGYSQGGMSALSEMRALQESYKGLVNKFSGYLGGGPYSMKAMLDNYVETDICGYPISFPLIIAAFKYSFPEIMTGEYKDYFTPEFIRSGILEKIRSKKYNNWQLCREMTNLMPYKTGGPVIVSQILKKDCLTPGNIRYEELFKCAELCEMTTGWKPENHIHFMHCENDAFVPYFNFEMAQSGIGNENCVFESLGDYGLGYRNHDFGGIMYYIRIICGKYLE